MLPTFMDIFLTLEGAISAFAADRIRWTYGCYVPRNSHSAGTPRSS